MIGIGVTPWRILVIAGAVIAPRPSARGHHDSLSLLGKEGAPNTKGPPPPRMHVVRWIHPLPCRAALRREGEGTQALQRREERQWRAVGGLPHHFDLLPDRHLVGLAIDDIGL